MPSDENYFVSIWKKAAGKARYKARSVAMLCVWCLWSGSCLEGHPSFYAQLLRLRLSLGNFKVSDFLKGNVECDKTCIKSAGSNIGHCSLWDTEEVTDLQKG